MNELIARFKECAHQTASSLGISDGRLLRAFGLKDFVDNVLADDDDSESIATKALVFFCEDGDPHSLAFKFGVLTVGIFLNEHHAKKRITDMSQQLRDLVAILVKDRNESQIRKWIESNF